MPPTDWNKELAKIDKQLESMSDEALLPAKSAALWAALGGPGKLEDQRHAALTKLDAKGWKVQKGDALFPRAEKPQSS